MEKILPRAMAVSAPYWEGCREGELRLQFCTACNHHQFYPRTLCSHCHSNALEWRRASGKGRIASFSVVHRGVSKAYPGPYVVALIDLDEGVRMMSNVVDVKPEEIAVGQPVGVTFEAWSEEVQMPMFRLSFEEPEAAV